MRLDISEPMFYNSIHTEQMIGFKGKDDINGAEWKQRLYTIYDKWTVHGRIEQDVCKCRE